ncbi:MAG: glycosyltransferase family 4 protein [Geminicoccales bacterium]
MSNKSMHRIAAIITHNDNGGAQQALARLCRSLKRNGHQIELWYLYREGDSQPVDVPHRFVLDRQARGVFDYLRLVSRLNTCIAQYKPDALISFLPLANTVGLLVGWYQGISIRIASQRNPVQTYSPFMRYLDWYVGTCGLYTHNVTNSGDVQSSVASYPLPYKMKTRIIYNGISPSQNTVNRADARAAFGLEKSDIALVSVGRIARQKNQIFLIQLLGGLPGFRLLIAGDGDDTALRTEAERMGVAPRVQFLGQLDSDRMNRLFRATDIFALPSLYEGQSNALLEAMAAGLPIVASDIPCHRETLLDGSERSGLVIPITEPNRWTLALNELANDVRLRKQISENASKRVSFFSLERMSSEFESIVKSASAT